MQAHAYEACTKFLRTHKPKRRIPAPAAAYQEMTTKEHLYEITVDMYHDEQELARGPKTSYVPCGLRKIAIRDWYAEDEEDSSGEDEDAEDEDRGSEEEEETGDDDD
ncbi:hypothetical protein BJ165DRAFT_1410906 [Panaeolus papilionaceus]|nr:hypothetical protein BJ165DRAFT_1410906 [Panaeolus papilionaceus]